MTRLSVLHAFVDPQKSWHSMSSLVVVDIYISFWKLSSSVPFFLQNGVVLPYVCALCIVRQISINSKSAWSTE